MIRPMTSNVSALSGIVANGHQAIHFVSSAPSKIPYGGFSPVRLQTRFGQRPPSRASQRPLIGPHCRYLVSRSFVRSGSCDQAAPRTSDHDRSSGPWLPSRLYCPASSSLTMATSAPLSATQQLMTEWLIVIYHCRYFTGWTGSLFGCQQGSQRRELYSFHRSGERIWSLKRGFLFVFSASFAV